MTTQSLSPEVKAATKVFDIEKAVRMYGEAMLACDTADRNDANPEYILYLGAEADRRRREIIEAWNRRSPSPSSSVVTDATTSATAALLADPDTILPPDILAGGAQCEE